MVLLQLPPLGRVAVVVAAVAVSVVPAALGMQHQAPLSVSDLSNVLFQHLCHHLQRSVKYLDMKDFIHCVNYYKKSK